MEWLFSDSMMTIISVLHEGYRKIRRYNYFGNAEKNKTVIFSVSMHLNLARSSQFSLSFLSTKKGRIVFCLIAQSFVER